MDQMSTTYRHANGAFTVVLPDDWEFAVRRSSVAFFHPSEGVGAMNVSAMIPQNGVAVDPAVVALDFVPKGVRTEVNLASKVADSQSKWAHAQYETDTDAWRLWVLCGLTQIVIVSYNCQRNSKGIEDPVVDQIVASIVVA
jgi:hypothetical protein